MPRCVCTVYALLLVATAASDLAAAQDVTDFDAISFKEVIASLIRNQGYICGSAKSIAVSEPKETDNGIAWVLQCTNARYRVVVVPHFATKIERVEK